MVASSTTSSPSSFCGSLPPALIKTGNDLYNLLSSSSSVVCDDMNVATAADSDNGLHGAVLAQLLRLDHKGLLRKADYAHYQKLLRQSSSETHVLEELHDQLRRIEQNGGQRDRQDAPPSGSTSEAVHENATIATVSHSMSSTTTMSQDDDDDESSYTSSSRRRRDQYLQGRTRVTSQPEVSSLLIAAPADLWSGRLALTSAQLQDLFCEMCFFARLGYTQPPSCLHCCYQLAHHQDAVADRDCRHWCVWRVDTHQLLHPRRLSGNILLVQCRAVQQLLQGVVVQGYRWNTHIEQLERLEELDDAGLSEA